MYLKFAMRRYHEELDSNTGGEAGGGGSSAGGNDGLDAGSISDSFDISKASDQIAADLGLGGDDPDKSISSSNEPGDKLSESEDSAAKEAEAKRIADEAAAAAAVQLKPAPKSWKKEMHEHWTKLTPEVQAYIEQREQENDQGFQQYGQKAKFADTLQKAFEPYQAHLQAHNIAPERAVQILLGTQYKLATGDSATKGRAIAGLMKDFNIKIDDINAAAGDEEPVKDPATKALEERLNRIEREKQLERERQYRELAAKNESEVQKFAADPAHPYFEEVADDMLPFLERGPTLEEAYKKAIWANDVTRAKEIARQNEAAEKDRRKRETEEAEKARKAAAANGSGRDTGRRPQDPIGSMDDTLHATLRDIKSRG